MSEERETVSWEEMTYSNYLSLEAFANLLIRKEILTKDEIIEEIISSPARFLPIPYCLSPNQTLHSIYCVLFC